MSLSRVGVFVMALVIGVGTQLDAQSLSLERVASGLANPTFATHAPDDAQRLFITQRSGAIRILNLDSGNLNGANFMTVPSVNTSFEGGLLGLAFHPDYQNNGHFYVNYTLSAGGAFRTRIARFTRTDDDSASSATQQVVVEIIQPQQNHNAGWIGFGPDGYLYVATGDGGNGNDTGAGHTPGIGNSQDITNNLLGKMLRLDVDGDDFPGDTNRNYAIPPSNPFIGVTGDDEIFIYGLRNPFRCSFDRDNGDLYIGDVGQGAREEIDVFPLGFAERFNMGWRLREGTIATPGVGGPRPDDNIDPIYDYPRTGIFGGNAVTGGVVYRGPLQGLSGNYFFADFGSNNFWSIRYDGSDPLTFDGTNFSTRVRWNGIFTTDVGVLSNIVAFGEDLDGNVYVVDFGGEVFKFADGTLTESGTLNLVIPFVGMFESGSLADLADSDDVGLKYRSVPAPTGDPSIRLEFRGNISTTSPSVIFFNMESRVTTPNVNQKIEFFNFLTGDYEEVDNRDASFTDDALTVEISSPNFFASVTGEVRTRVTWSATGPVIGFPWATVVDQVGWDFID